MPVGNYKHKFGHPVGYIVVTDTEVCQLMKTKLLFAGDHATVFTSNCNAQRAIDRTVNYAKATGQTEWPDADDYRIVPLLPAV